MPQAHVLVVDDEPDILKLVQKILEGEGHRVTIARDGTSNSAAAPASPPPSPNAGPPAPRNADDARNAFDRLFKKL